MLPAKMEGTGIYVIVYRVIPVLCVNPKSTSAYQDHVSVVLVLTKWMATSALAPVGTLEKIAT